MVEPVKTVAVGRESIRAISANRVCRPAAERICALLSPLTGGWREPSREVVARWIEQRDAVETIVAKACEEWEAECVRLAVAVDRMAGLLTCDCQRPPPYAGAEGTWLVSINCPVHGDGQGEEAINEQSEHDISGGG